MYASFLPISPGSHGNKTPASSTESLISPGIRGHNHERIFAFLFDIVAASHVEVSIASLRRGISAEGERARVLCVVGWPSCGVGGRMCDCGGISRTRRNPCVSHLSTGQSEFEHIRRFCRFVRIHRHSSRHRSTASSRLCPFVLDLGSSNRVLSGRTYL